MYPETDLTAADGVRSSLGESARWIVKLALSAIRPQGGNNFLLLSPPFTRRQKVLDRRAGVTRMLSVQDNSDYGALARLFGDEAYRLDRLARGNDLLASYHSILAARATPLILDCGTDSGLSTRYFADAYPGARVVGVEPDQRKFAQALANCAVANVELRRAEIASECRRAGDPTGDDRSPGTADAATALDTLSINSLLAEQCATGGWPFIIKIDPDQFEDELFSRNSEWIDEFPLLIVELRKWRLPSRRRSRHLLRRLADADRDFVFLGEALFSIANDRASGAQRQTYVDVLQDVAPYHIRAAI
jgi:hypothetical protein